MFSWRSERPKSPSRTNWRYWSWVLAVALAQHLDRHDLAGLAVDGAIHPGERAAADEVEDLVVAEEEAGSLPLDQAVDLVVGHHLAADQELEELVDR